MITRPIDDVGRIVLPKEMRRFLNINNNDVLEISQEGNKIILSKPEQCCAVCGEKENLAKIRSKFVCKDCFCELIKLHNETTFMTAEEALNYKFADEKGE